MSARSLDGDVAVVIAARNEADRIQATVAAAAGLAGVGLIVVVDDGSRDATAAVARRAGAAVMRHPRNRGKGAAMETGAEAVRLIDQREHRDRPGTCCSSTRTWATPPTGRAADGSGGRGHGGHDDRRVRGHRQARRPRPGSRAFRAGIRRATGWQPRQPLNGQRCLTRAAFEAARPLAHYDYIRVTPLSTVLGGEISAASPDDPAGRAGAGRNPPCLWRARRHLLPRPAADAGAAPRLCAALWRHRGQPLLRHRARLSDDRRGAQGAAAAAEHRQWLAHQPQL